jgi:hypothetical protein
VYTPPGFRRLSALLLLLLWLVPMQALAATPKGVIPANKRKPAVSRTATPAQSNQQQATQAQQTAGLSREDIQKLASLEEKLFMETYLKEAPEARLSRLESTVFGQARTDVPMPERISQLQQTVMPHQETVSPIATTQPAAEPPITTQPQPPRTEAVDATDYPSVTMLEERVFGTTYVKEDITRRLARLEGRVFGYEQRGAMADRLAQLQMTVLGTTDPGKVVLGSPPAEDGRTPLPSDVYTHPYNGQAASSYASIPPVNNPYQPASPQYNDPQMMRALDDVERNVLRTTFPGDPLDARLARLENHIFHSTSPEMEPGDRLMRIMAVASAGGDRPPTPQSRAKSTFQSLLPIIITILPMLLL